MAKKRVILNNWIVRANTIMKRTKGYKPNPTRDEIAAGLQRAYSDGRRSVLRDQWAKDADLISEKGQQHDRADG
jgi:hypothetical protein